MKNTITSGLSNSREIDKQYATLRGFITASFERLTEGGTTPLFTTATIGLFDAYLTGIPEEYRQTHNCRTCRKFIEDFGGLVAINEDGNTSSVMFSSGIKPPYLFLPSYARMKFFVEKAKVTGVFLPSTSELGRRQTGSWSHFAVTVTPYSHPVKTAAQAMAEKLEDFKNMQRALAEFPVATVEQAVALLRTDSLYRSEKCLGQAEWLLQLHMARRATRNQKLRDNILWRAVATAPAGFCHPRSSMIGTLLEDIAAGKSFEDAAAAFKAKMHPLQYQRPQATPSAGSITVAEKLFAKMGLERALDRRYARLQEVITIWTPRPTKSLKSAGSGIFSHLKTVTTPVSTMTPTPQIMTWIKFRDTILPTAGRIEYYVSPFSNSYGAIVTAAYDDAPIITQWGNPFSWYLYHGGSIAQTWGLQTGVWKKVTAFVPNPAKWEGEDKSPHHNSAVMAVIDGAKDSRYQGCGNALFPEILKNELREVRSVIEAYSRSAVLQGQDEGDVCGLIFAKGDSFTRATFRVTSTSGNVMQYSLDRWD